MNKPLISIVLPTYNRSETFLKNAVMSTLAQTYNNFEVLVVDNGSDNTSELISSNNDNRIRYFKPQPPTNEYSATNQGASLATGKYLTWVHSDDVLPIDSLQLRVEVLENDPQLDFVHGDIMIIDKDNNEIQKKEATNLIDKSVFKTFLKNLGQGKMISTLIHHTTVMMKKNFFYKAGPFDSSLPFAGDIDWLIRATRIGSFQRIPKILYRYRKHSQTRRELDPKKGINVEAVHRLIASRYV